VQHRSKTVGVIAIHHLSRTASTVIGATRIREPLMLGNSKDVSCPLSDNATSSRLKKELPCHSWAGHLKRPSVLWSALPPSSGWPKT